MAKARQSGQVDAPPALALNYKKRGSPMSSWLNHLYFENLYDAILPMQDALDFKAPLSEVRIAGLPINLHDPAFVQLAKVIDFKVSGDESSLMALKSAFF